MPSRRYFANNAPQLTLNGSIASGATSLVISGTFSGWPTQFPYFAALDYGTASAEIISVTNVVGTTATIVRAQGGTAAISHTAGATLDHVAVALDLDEANAHTSANTGVHGVSGSVVGTSDSQTLTNKTLAAPVLTGTTTGASATLSGTLGVTGAVTLSSTLAVTGNATLGGTVTVTGASAAASYAAAGNGAVTGVLVPKTYTNEAAATAAIGAPVTGTEVWLTAPTGAGTSAGLFTYNGSWTPVKRPRIGARATTTATQAISASTLTTLTNGGSAAWTATEDSGGFVSATGGTTTPITIPAGLGGLYQVGVHYIQAANSATRQFSGILVNGTDTAKWFPAYGEAVSNGSVPIPLNAGDTLGMNAFTSTATNASVGCQIFCYRISD